jgi:hypothetical protein
VPAAQWVNFLRSHDELDLGRLTETQRDRVFQTFAPAKEMQLYNRGIRRRLAPMLDNDRRKLEVAFNLLFTLPARRCCSLAMRLGLATICHFPNASALGPRCVVQRAARRVYHGDAARVAGDLGSDLRLSTGQH